MNMLSPAYSMIKLERVFASSHYRIMELRSQLHSLRKGYRPIDDYFLEAKMLLDNLTSVGEILFEKDIVLSVISSLGSDWNNFVTFFNLHVEPIGLDELHIQLVNHEIMKVR